MMVFGGSAVPEQPNLEQDPITTKSYAAYYLIAMVILMATLFWALWDEAWTQRPWKAVQAQWKDRYPSFLNTARCPPGSPCFPWPGWRGVRPAGGVRRPPRSTPRRAAGQAAPRGGRRRGGGAPAAYGRPPAPTGRSEER